MRLDAYKDSGGVWTIGWGHTGELAREGVSINTAAAEVLFRDDWNHAEKAVMNALTQRVNDNQFGALVCLTFNIGAKAFAESTLARLINAGMYKPAAQEFLRWVYDNKKKLAGLERRRVAEQALFLKKP